MQEDSDGTIRRMLSAYELGRKIRSLRLKKKIALIDLGRHTGLSASLLSQIETSRLTPTLPTLTRIAMVFDVGLEYFFTVTHKPMAIVRANERMRFPDNPHTAQPQFYFECLAYSAQDKDMQAYIAEFPSRSAQELEEHSHEGSEFLYVMDGSLAIRYRNEEHTLEVGDSAYFDAMEPHGYRGLSDNARAIVVTSIRSL